MTEVVVVWDGSGDPPAAANQVFSWQSYQERPGLLSVPRFLEDNSDRIRARYLQFIRDLGEHRIGARRVIDHLDPGDGFSFWWLTLLSEKSPLKSSRIYDCLRLFALEEMLSSRRPRRLTLVSPDRKLAGAIATLCKSLGARFRWQAGGSPRKELLRSCYEALPGWIKGVASLRHLGRLWQLRKLKDPGWAAGPDATFLCSYFIHLDPARCAQGQFHSRQWGDLPRFLHAQGDTNWLQLFLESSVVPTAAAGVECASRFNADAARQGRHAFVDSYLSATVLCKALQRWLWLNLVGWRLRTIAGAFRPRGSAVCLWPLLQADWRASISGPVAMSNCLWTELFDAALASMPHQSKGLYLYENQSWEKAFLRAWRRNGHGRIIGVQHATVPYWFLAYSEHPDCLRADAPAALPLPDLLATNGMAARGQFAGSGFSSLQLVEVEALRYIGLAGLAGRREFDRSRRDRASSSEGEHRSIRVLILGDIVPASMRHLLSMLDQTLGGMPEGYEFTFKPHPGYAPDMAGYTRLHARQTKDALDEILGNFDAVVSANGTSAAVDAYVAGLPVIIALDGHYLNMSPLRGQPGVQFVSTSTELSGALLKVAGDRNGSDADHETYFFLDPALPRWKQLLVSAAHA